MPVVTAAVFKKSRRENPVSRLMEKLLHYDASRFGLRTARVRYPNAAL
jgi:hypothetical protein